MCEEMKSNPNPVYFVPVRFLAGSAHSIKVHADWFMSIRLAKLFFLSAALIALNCSVQAAPVAPDAGQTSRELQQQPELIPPQTPEPLPLESDTVPKSGTSDQVRINVKAIHVSGSSVYTASDLEALVADLVGGERSLADLDAGAARITAFYRAHGYLVARAYLPAQDIKEGVVTISVLEGRVGEQRINNRSRLSDERASSYLSGIKSGEALLAKSANRALLLLNDTPGVGSAKAALQPGASVGTSDLIVELTPSAPYAANVDLDNYGNRYTGENRLGAGLALNSPLHFGDQLSLSALVSDQHLTYLRIGYQIPVGGNGVRLGAAYSDSRYRLGKEFAMLKAHGSAASSSLYAMYPFIRGQAANLTGIATWERKKLNDSTDAPVTGSDKQVELVNLGLAGNRQDTLGGGGITSFDLTLVSGNLDMDAASLASDQSSAKSNGSFIWVGYDIKRLQHLTAVDTLSFALSGQLASKNLNTSEKFYLGGAHSIRAYPQGEVSGDEGYCANLELRHGYAATLQTLLFYDAGSVKINLNPYIAGIANTRFIAGAGVGVNALLAGMQLKASLAWRTSGGDPTSDPSRRNPRLWLMAGKQF